MSATQGVRVISQSGIVGAYASTDSAAYFVNACPNCGANQLIVIAYTVDSNGQATEQTIRWLRCPSCLKGCVNAGGQTFPTSTPMREPKGLPGTDKQIWNEARACLGAGAPAAAVMLCRKLLLHIAVANGLSAKNAKDRSPGFMEAVEHLQSEGLITPKMRTWVDRIKDVGNDANHELTPITPQQAADVATFTEQLLVLAYELDALMADPTEDGPTLTL